MGICDRNRWIPGASHPPDTTFFPALHHRAGGPASTPLLAISPPEPPRRLIAGSRRDIWLFWSLLCPFLLCENILRVAAVEKGRRRHLRDLLTKGDTYEWEGSCFQQDLEQAVPVSKSAPRHWSGFTCSRRGSGVGSQVPPTLAQVI